MKTPKVNVVLPNWLDHPVGGYKIAYQYANALAGAGFEVALVHPWRLHGDEYPSVQGLRWPEQRLRIALRRTSCVTWFRLDPRVRLTLPFRLSARALPGADFTILTAWQTADATREAPSRAGVLLQIVHDYEFWMERGEERGRMESALRRTDVIRVSPSSGVSRMLREIGSTSAIQIPDGLDSGQFGVDTPPQNRDLVVGFPLRGERSKDLPTALAAAELIWLAYPDVRIESFRETAAGLPPRLVQHGRLSDVDLRKFYNRCAVFMLSSRYEGWGLPALEAMACGAAVVSTRNGGTEDFVTDGESGRLVSPADPDALAGAVIELLADRPMRLRLAENGVRRARELSIDRSAAALIAFVRSLDPKSG
jgi:glycosyltransferase involved in cell wall biosynthesis